MNVPLDLRYTKDHEWARVEGAAAVIGITDHAQESLGDIVFLELPEIGKELAAGDVFGVVESVKAVSDLYSPVSGKVIAVNSPLVDKPETINADAYGAAWMIKVHLSDPAEVNSLMDPETYEKYLAEEN